MKNKGLNLGLFKKLSENNSHAELIHPNGHKIIISKNALHPKLQKQLKELPVHMAKGGDTLNVSEMPKEQIIDPTEDIAKMSPQEQAIEERVNYLKQFRPNEFRDEEDMKRFAQNELLGQVKQKEYEAADVLKEKQRQAAEDIQYNKEAQSRGLPLRNVSQYGQPIGSAPQENVDLKSIGINTGGPGSTAVNPMLAAAQYTQKGLEAGFGEEAAGIKGRQTAEENLFRLKEQEAKNFTQQLNDLQQTFNEKRDQYFKESENALRDLKNGKIDPNRVWANKSTPEKVGTILGLIFGGFATSFGGGPNPASEMLNKEIDRDMEAQKKNLDKQENVLSSYLRMTKDMGEAMALTKSFYIDAYKSKIEEAASKFGTEDAKNKALIEIGKLDQQKAQVLAPYAMKKSLEDNMQSGKLDPAYTIQYFAPEKDREKLFKSLEDMKSVEKLRDQALEDFDKIVQIQKDAKALKMSPLQAYNQIKAIKGGLIPVLSKDTTGRYTESDSKALDEVLSSLTSDDATNVVQRKALNRIFEPKLIKSDLVPYHIRPKPPKPMPVRGF